MIQNFIFPLDLDLPAIQTLIASKEQFFGAVISLVDEPVVGVQSNVATFDSNASTAPALVLKQFPATLDENSLAAQLNQLQQQQSLILTSYAIVSVKSQDTWLAVFRQAAAPPPILGAGQSLNNIFATEFGGGSDFPMNSAYGGVVKPTQPQAALPARLAQGNRQIKVTNPANGLSVQCLVNDIGPWNTRDQYWANGTRPLSETQFANQTPAQNNQVPSNKAGIDLTPAAMDALSVVGAVNTRSATFNWQFV